MSDNNPVVIDFGRYSIQRANTALVEPGLRMHVVHAPVMPSDLVKLQRWAEEWEMTLDEAAAALLSETIRRRK